MSLSSMSDLLFVSLIGVGSNGIFCFVDLILVDPDLLTILLLLMRFGYIFAGIGFSGVRFWIMQGITGTGYTGIAGVASCCSESNSWNSYSSENKSKCD